jgi:hypothetical protein
MKKQHKLMIEKKQIVALKEQSGDEGVLYTFSIFCIK